MIIKHRIVILYNLDLMKLVKIKATPNDGFKECKNVATFISNFNGG